MGVRELLDCLESKPVPFVPSEPTCQGTATSQYYQRGSLCSLSSPEISNPQANGGPDLKKSRNINAIKTLYECGYRPPFCACGFYKFPG